MFRRAWLSILPAFLALAFLMGTPGVSVAGPEASAAPWSPAALSPTPAHGNLSEDNPDAVVNLRSDQDDSSDDGIVQAVTVIVWPEVSFEVPIVVGTIIVSPTHWPCAGPARAPPIA